MKTLLIWLSIMILFGCNTTAVTPHTTKVNVTGVVTEAIDKTGWGRSTQTWIYSSSQGYVMVVSDYGIRIGMVGDTVDVTLSFKHSDAGECDRSQTWIIQHPRAYNEKYGAIKYKVNSLKRNE